MPSKDDDGHHDRVDDLPHVYIDSLSRPNYLEAHTNTNDSQSHHLPTSPAWANTPTPTKMESGFPSMTKLRHGTIQPNVKIRTPEELTQAEIDTVLSMLKTLEFERTNFTSRDDSTSFLKNLERDTTLRNHLIKLRNKLNVLQWRTFAATADNYVFNLDPMVVDRRLDIQRETATSTGALAALGASLSMSILYSGTRGDMWPFFVAWWLFVISLAVTSALATSTVASSMTTATDLLETYNDGTISDSTEQLAMPTTKNWLLRRLSVFAVFISLTAVVGGWAALAAAVGGYSVTDELDGGDPRITGGPSLGHAGRQLWVEIVLYICIGVFGGGMAGAYLFRLRLFSRAWKRATLE